MTPPTALNGPIVVLCDPTTDREWARGRPMDQYLLVDFARKAKSLGLTREDFHFVGLSPPVPEMYANSQSKRWEHVQPYATGVVEHIKSRNPRAVVAFGDLATRVVTGRPVKITKARGLVRWSDQVDCHVLPMLAPSFIKRVPDHEPTFLADLSTLARFRDADFDPDGISGVETNYEWCLDIQHLLDNPPEILAVDTETTSLVTQEAECLTVQLTWEAGHSLVCPTDCDYYPEMDERTRVRLVAQLKELLENPRIKKIGHYCKYDHQILRYALDIRVANWSDDTNLLVFAVDENLMSKGLDDSIRVFVPEMSGYNDELNRLIDKTNMRTCSHEHMLQYAGGDTDATFRLWQVLRPILESDPRQLNCYEKIQMPGLVAFAEVVEHYGVMVDQDRLREFGQEVTAWISEHYRSLVRRVPPEIRRKRLVQAGNSRAKHRTVLSFGSPAFIREILFGEDGFGLEPVTFTASTRNLPPEERVPSTSAKEQLIYYIDRGDHAGEFCADLTAYQRALKLNSTYIGIEENQTGFWKYIRDDGCIHPSYTLTSTNTGRTASREPNGQNVPKRGQWAKPYGKCLVARPGYILVAADLSQIELRIMAVMSGDENMLEVYRLGGDVHTATAAGLRFRDEIIRNGLASVVANLWPTLTEEDQKAFRRSAKVVNFGLLYYMSAAGFKRYAKQEFNENYTDQEALDAHTSFFTTYEGVKRYHRQAIGLVHEQRYIRALHGAKRSLPSILSNDRKIVAMAERQAINAPVQRLGSDLGVNAMARFTSQVPDHDDCHVHQFVHDQIVAEVRIGLEREYASALKYAMESTPLDDFDVTFPIPIISNVEFGPSVGEMEEDETIEAIKPSWWDDDEAAAMDRFMRRVP